MMNSPVDLLNERLKQQISRFCLLILGLEAQTSLDFCCVVQLQPFTDFNTGSCVSVCVLLRHFCIATLFKHLCTTLSVYTYSI